MPRASVPLDAEGLYQQAVRVLARRERSEQELRQRLLPRAVSAAALEQALERLRTHGYLDDTRLAQAAAAQQKDGLRHGRLRALRELQSRGLAPGLAETAVAAAYARGSEDAQLRAYLQKKRLQRPEDMRHAASLYRRLRMAGFSGAACQRALRAWRVDTEWLEALDEE